MNMASFFHTKATIYESIQIEQYIERQRPKFERF